MSNIRAVDFTPPKNAAADIPATLRKIADELEAGMLDAASACLVTMGNPRDGEPIRVFGMGVSAELPDCVVMMELGKMRLLRMPAKLIMSGGE